MLSPGDASGRLLIVDDDAINRAILENIFAPFYAIDEAEDGDEGLAKILARPERFCAVLLDVVMPRMDGLEVLERLRESALTETVERCVFLITAEASDANMRRAYDLGVMDVISKPVVPYIVLKRVQSVIELFQARKRLRRTVASQQTKLLAQAEKIIRLNQGMIEALSTAIEFRSEESGDHVRRIHDITWNLLTYTALGDGLDSETIEQIALASIMHDVGKIAIPGRHPQQARQIDGRGIRGHEDAHHAGRAAARAHPPAARNGPLRLRRRHCPPSPRALGRPRLSRRTARRCNQRLGAGRVSGGRLRRAHQQARLQGGFSPRKALEMIKNGECGVFGPHLLECFFAVEEDLFALYRP